MKHPALTAFDSNRLGDYTPTIAGSPRLNEYFRRRAAAAGVGDEIELLQERSASLDALLTPPALQPFQRAAIARMEAAAGAARTADSEVDEVDVRSMTQRDIAVLCGLEDEYDEVVSGRRGPAASYRMRVYGEFEPDWNE